MKQLLWAGDLYDTSRTIIGAYSRERVSIVPLLFYTILSQLMTQEEAAQSVSVGAPLGVSS